MVTEWVIICNPDYYDLKGAFQKYSTIDWKQSNKICEGDLVYIYVGASRSEKIHVRLKNRKTRRIKRPDGSLGGTVFEYPPTPGRILYKCRAVKVNISPDEVEEDEFSYGDTERAKRYMRLQKIEEYEDGRYPRTSLEAHGLKTVQGASRVSPELSAYLASGGEGRNMNRSSLFDCNMILYGPPGTGKTYHTVLYAVAICDGKSLEEVKAMPYAEVLRRFQELKSPDMGRVAFTTFHQSYGYEEFIEGIRPRVEEEDSGKLSYQIVPGLFKKFCDEARNRAVTVKSARTDIKENPTVWCVLLDGTGHSQLKTYCFAHDEIRIGWRDWEERITEDTKRLNDKTRAILINFQENMEQGDIVLIEKNNTSIDAIGIIDGEYRYDKEGYENYPRTRKVRWVAKDIDENIMTLNGGKRLDRKTVYPLPSWRIDLAGILSLIQKYDKSSRFTVQEEESPCVFIIDEINRGNISRIFGELITLIERSKRKKAEEEMSVTLPYSGETFSVPQNVYLLGTMNTADRSIALMDTALRRRFSFIEMMPDPDILEGVEIKEGDQVLAVPKMLQVINERISYLYDREHMIGHAFFVPLRKEPSLARLSEIFLKQIIPLLQEYFYEDYEKMQLVLGDNQKSQDAYKFILDTKVTIKTIFNGHPEMDLPEKTYEIQTEAFTKLQSYKEIGAGL